MNRTPFRALALAAAASATTAALTLGPHPAASAAATAAVPSPAGAIGTGPVVTTASGQVQGRIEDGVASWKGIPFAAAPVGALRWRAPQPAAAWSGVRQADAYGHDCMQLPFPSDAAPLGTPPAEDCLYLNVWKPQTGLARLPVIVWIYGGGFVNGGSSPPTYSGAALARQGALVVSFNYRLGRFGFFAHPQLTRADADAGRLGNYGFLDQVAALEWVRRNAAGFGGDPANVTIIGESAGGVSVHTLMTSPLAEGLFTKAVILSGGDGRANAAGLAGAERAGVEFARKKGIAAADPQALARLRALAPEDVVDGMNLASRPASDPPTWTGPFVDGRVALDPLEVYRAGRLRKMPVMVGATSADIGGTTGYMVAGARSVAALLADQGLPVYEYRFSYVARSLGQAGAPTSAPTSAPTGAPAGAQHASDIPYFFDTVAIKYGDRSDAKDIRMGKMMSAYLVNFARRGDPNGNGLPAWPRYTRAGDQLLDFGAAGMPVAGKDAWGAQIDSVHLE